MKFFVFFIFLNSACALEFNDLVDRDNICLYAGDKACRGEQDKKFVGLSINKQDSQHIKHDVTKTFPLKTSTVDLFQSEDVFEHIDYKNLSAVIDEIFRILKVGGIFRLSLPDYRCDVLYNRSQKDDFGNIIFDSGGGGKLVNGKVTDGGHLWFPVFETVFFLLHNSKFMTNGSINFLHYYDTNGIGITNPIDYTNFMVSRTPDHDLRVKYPYRPMSIVVDCVKTSN
jgi:SAM-dependent methyltransferase